MRESALLPITASFSARKRPSVRSPRSDADLEAHARLDAVARRPARPRARGRARRSRSRSGSRGCRGSRRGSAPARSPSSRAAASRVPSPPSTTTRSSLPRSPRAAARSPCQRAPAVERDAHAALAQPLLELADEVGELRLLGLHADPDRANLHRPRKIPRCYVARMPPESLELFPERADAARPDPRAPLAERMRPREPVGGRRAGRAAAARRGRCARWSTRASCPR